MIDKALIQRKVKLIQEDIARLREFSGKSFEEIAANALLMGAVERYLERMIMRAIDVNQHIIVECGDGSEAIRGYYDTFIVLPKFGVYDVAFAKEIAPSAGLRNRLVHDYNNTDSKLIYASVESAIRQYARYCEFVFAFSQK